MKKTGNLALVLWAASWGWSASAATLDDIQFWAGDGTNRAGLVIDWNAGANPRSLVWGYRWNGTATGMDMLQAVVTADPRLFAHMGRFSWGTSLFGIGYDLNLATGFSVTPALAFGANGLVVETGGDNAIDARVATDSADHFLEGWNSGFWAYYLRNPESEGWSSAMTGAEGRILADGAWDGLTFAADFDSSEPSEPAPAFGNPFGFEIVEAQGPFGAPPYDDPVSLLGKPSADYYDPQGGWSGGTTSRRVKLVEAAFNLALNQTSKLITTLRKGAFIVVRFDQPVRNDPAHPYGIDLLVFGNTFYTPSGFVNDSSDMNTLLLKGGAFHEPMKVSVSPGYAGKPGQSPTHPASWDWYRFDNGPYADTGFATQGYQWNPGSAKWSDEEMNFTKPVNPVFGPVLEAGNGLSAADAIRLYDGSGGGTGFDIAESGFDAIQYVKIEALEDFDGGEVDALSAVRPAVLGDSLTIAPANLTNGMAALRFQQAANTARPALALDFTSVSGAARVVATPLAATSVLPSPFAGVLTASKLAVAPVLGGSPIAFSADLRVWAGSAYQGNGQDLILLRQAGNDWEDVESTYDPSTRSVWMPGLTHDVAVALVQMRPPRIGIAVEVDGFGGRIMAVRFGVLPGFAYTLERASTPNFSDAGEVASIRPRAAGEAKLDDGGLSGGTFYRVRVNRR